MNYYNPYYMVSPMMNAAPSVARSAGTGLFSRLLGGKSLSFSSILSGTSKALNVVNQAIPIVQQASPIMRNAKTMFKVMNEFKKVDTPSTASKETTRNNIKKTDENANIQKEEVTTSPTGPTFFL